VVRIESVNCPEVRSNIPNDGACGRTQKLLRDAEAVHILALQKLLIIVSYLSQATLRYIYYGLCSFPPEGRSVAEYGHLPRNKTYLQDKLVLHPVCS